MWGMGAWTFYRIFQKGFLCLQVQLSAQLQVLLATRLQVQLAARLQVQLTMQPSLLLGCKSNLPLGCKSSLPLGCKSSLLLLVSVLKYTSSRMTVIRELVYFQTDTNSCWKSSCPNTQNFTNFLCVVDDIAVYGESEGELEEQFSLFLDICRENHLTLSLKKFQSCVSRWFYQVRWDDTVLERIITRP